MNDFLSDPKSIITGLLGLFVGLLTYVGNGAMKRLEHLEKNTVSKEQWKDMREELRKEHGENSGRLDDMGERIDAGLSGIHQRIDKLFEFLRK